MKTINLLFGCCACPIALLLCSLLPAPAGAAITGGTADFKITHHSGLEDPFGNEIVVTIDSPATPRWPFGGLYLDDTFGLGLVNQQLSYSEAFAATAWWADFNNSNSHVVGFSDLTFVNQAIQAGDPDLAARGALGHSATLRYDFDVEFFTDAAFTDLPIFSGYDFTAFVGGPGSDVEFTSQFNWIDPNNAANNKTIGFNQLFLASGNQLFFDTKTFTTDLAGSFMLNGFVEIRAKNDGGPSGGQVIDTTFQQIAPSGPIPEPSVIALAALAVACCQSVRTRL